MFGQRRVNDAVLWYMGELGARVVAESGRPSDRFHLGKLILQGLKDEPDFTLQIDGATGESETNGSVLKRSVQCAEAFKAMRLERGDVIVLMAPNHLDLCIPYYAALYIGVAVAPTDRTLGINELGSIFIKDEPKLVFCQSVKANEVRTALKNCKIESKVVTFDKEAEDVKDSINFGDLMKNYGTDTNIYDFKPTDFDPEETTAFLVSTSGSTGLPKKTIGTHKNCTIGSTYIWASEFKFPYPTRMSMVVSPLQWVSAMYKFSLCPILRYTRLQTSKDLDQEHAYYLINTYKPTYLLTSPTLLATLLKSSKGKCDWTCFEYVIVGGGTVSNKLLEEFKEAAPKVQVVSGYGASEINTAAFSIDGDRTPGSLGKPLPHLQYRLIDADTNMDILEPNLPGELWIKGPSVTKGYYKEPEVTKEVFSEDGWFKTGDMIYRDENWSFFFVERIKMLLKYRNHQVSPAEIQLVIATHPGVLDVAVAGIPDYECGDLPVACVVKRPGSNVSAQEIKDLVKNNLTDTKQLRGGVIFLNALPTTPGGKVDNKKLKEIILEAERE